MANNSELGKILVDGSGRTLYLFEADKGGSSTSYNECAQVWPPLTTQGKPTAGQGASADKLGTITQKNGDTQVTDNGHPLYYYAPDDQPGDIKGQELEQFGAEWYVVSPSGNKVEEGEGGGTQYMMVEELDSEKLVAGGYVADLCERFLDVLSEVLGASQEELLRRWDKRGSFAGESSDEGSDFDPPAGEAYELRASWRFLDRGGMHARPAVLPGAH